MPTSWISFSISGKCHEILGVIWWGKIFSEQNSAKNMEKDKKPNPYFDVGIVLVWYQVG